MPPAVRQYEIRSGGRFIARPDFAYPEARLGIEGQSFLHHGSKLQFKRDMQRHALTESVGWYLVYVTWWDVEHTPDETRAASAASTTSAWPCSPGMSNERRQVALD
jgi:hypothetical protein